MPNQTSAVVKKIPTRGGCKAHVGSILASHPAAPCSILSVPQIFTEENLSIIDAAEVNQRHLLEDSGLKMLMEPI